MGTRHLPIICFATTFRYTRSKVDQLSNQTVSQAEFYFAEVLSAFRATPIYDDPASPDNENVTWILPLPGKTKIDELPNQEFVLRRYVLSWWSDEALRDPGIYHKMVIFWHQYMAVSNLSNKSTGVFDYLSLLRWGALGNFKKLARKMIMDNTMLLYLNNHQNTLNNPNENFAREFLELFTILKGEQVGPGDYTNYTEDDIVEGAKVLTGCRAVTDRSVVDDETGIPRGDYRYNLHTKGDKTFSERFNKTVIKGAANTAEMPAELDDYVDMIFAQPETAKNLCRRLYRFFVHKTISSEIETDIIEPLANTLIANNFEVLPVIQKLLKSEHFFDADDSDNADEIIGGLIKSPLELVYQSLSFFNLSPADPATEPGANYLFHEFGLAQRLFALANYSPFNPSDVAGYPGFYQDPDYSRAWFNSSTIIARYKVPAALLSGRRTIGSGVNQPLGVKLDIAPWVKTSGVITDPNDPYVLVQDLLNYMLPEAVDNDRFNYFYDTVFLDHLPPADWSYEWQNYLNSNDDSEVKIALERLINAIMYSPEYQTF
ncbi:MAG: DUF1800 family protein [Saprospiraceae bacterium]